jgi:hypothetical protein
MDSLNLPTYEYRLEKRAGKLVIFDPIRKKFIVLTPEEWVRQHFVNYLCKHLGYPMSRMGVELGNKYHELRKRSDIVFYDQEMNPLVIVECKAPHIKISQAVFDQISVYNKTIKAKLLIVTNGIEHIAYSCNHKTSELVFLEKVPSYEELKIISNF